MGRIRAGEACQVTGCSELKANDDGIGIVESRAEGRSVIDEVAAEERVIGINVEVRG